MKTASTRAPKRRKKKKEVEGPTYIRIPSRRTVLGTRTHNNQFTPVAPPKEICSDSQSCHSWDHLSMDVLYSRHEIIVTHGAHSNGRSTLGVSTYPPKYCCESASIRNSTEPRNTASQYLHYRQPDILREHEWKYLQLCYLENALLPDTESICATYSTYNSPFSRPSGLRFYLN